MAGRPERPLDPDSGPVQRLAYELRKLREAAGGLNYREMARRTGCGASTLSYAAAGERLPTLPVLLAYVEACGGASDTWEERWHQAVREVAEEAAHDEDTDAPYRGLERFEPGDRHLFFGRTEFVSHLVAQVRAHRLVAVVGASGSGKSSLLRAGLIPALRKTDPQGQQAAAIRVLTPGPRPLVRSALLAPQDDARDTVVFIDQFEEVFTLCADPAERMAFLDLLAAAAAPDSRLRVVIAVRADFFGRCAEHRVLAEALRAATLVLGPMGPAALREAVIRPAAAAGLVVERGLTARIVREVAEEPGSLPLMSHALLETWRRRRGRTLTQEMYEAAGGIHGAIATTAERVYGEFAPAEALAARHILLRLVAPGEGTQDTRRPADRAELTGIGGRTRGGADDPVPARVLERLARARLLTLDGDSVNLAHEAVITAWPRLSSWAAEDRERLRVHRRLTEAARTWEELDHDPGALYRGNRLTIALNAFGDGEPDGLTGPERDFLDAGLNAREADERTAARTSRRLRTLTATLSALLVLAVVAGGLAWHLSRTGDAARQGTVTAQRIANSRQLATQSDSLLSSDPDLASLLAVEAYRSSPTVEATGSLYAAAAVPLRKRLAGHTGAVTATAFAPDGRTLASGSADGTIRLWNAAGRPLGVLRTNVGGVAALAFAPDHRHLLAAYVSGAVQVWDASARRARLLLHGPTNATATVFSPDGRLLAVSTGAKVQLWDTTTGATRASFTAPWKVVTTLAFDGDGGRLTASGMEGAVRVWDTASGRQLIQVHTPDSALALTPDGRTLAVGGAGGSITLWNTRTAALQGRLTGGTGQVGVLAFGRDGTMLASGGSDHAVRVWDIPARRARLVLHGHQASVEALAFSPDGKLLVSGAGDDAARLWNTPPDPVRAVHGVVSPLLAVDPADGRIATDDNDGGVQLRKVSGAPDRVFTGDPHSTVAAVAFSPDGRLLAVDEGDHVDVHDTATGTVLRDLSNRTPLTGALAFSPDGRTLATGGPGSVTLWQVATGQAVQVAPLQGDAVLSLAFAPGGRTLAIGGNSGRARLWDMASRRTRTTILPPAPIENSQFPPGPIAYSPDGRTLALVGADGTVSMCDPATGRIRARLVVNDARITSLAFSPDSRTMATLGDDGTLRLWDNATARVRTALSAGVGTLDGVPVSLGVVFAPDGRTLTTLVDMTLGVWTVPLPRPSQAAARVCEAVDRDLSARERTVYLPGHTTAPVCRPPLSDVGR